MADTSSGLVGGRYRVLGNLGKGAMGLVFMAYDPVLDRKVAIKQMTAEIADNEELRQRFYVEARAAARLNHPNIITIHELQESGGEIFMIMELLEGKSLASLVEAKPVPLSLEATLDVMGQVCDGLDYAHQKAIVHRDIKPANLFLTATGTVKVLDFGIARLGTLHMTATGALIGTPDYMAPEQIRGDEIDRRTDLWAVGAVLYQLLSGTKPFEGRPLARLLSAISQTPHVPLQQRTPAVPRSVSDLVDRLLSKPREGRPASAGLVRDELRAILGRESSSATKAMLAQEGYEETVFVVTPTKPSAPGTAPAAQAAAAPPAERPPVIGIAPTIEAPLPRRTAAPKTPEILRPGGSMATTAADEPTAESDRTVATTSGTAVPSPPVTSAPVVSVIEPPPRLPVVPPVPKPLAPSTAVPPVAIAPAVSSVAMPDKKRTSGLLVAAIVVAVVGLFVAAGVGGAAWWWWNSRQQGSVAESGRQGPPAATASVPPAAAPSSGAATAPASQPPAPSPAAETPSEKPVPQTATPVEPAPARGQAGPPPSAVTVTQVPPTVQPAATPPVQPPPVPPAAEEAARQRAAAAPSPKPTAVPPAQPPVETGVTTRAGARPGVSENTVETLSGRQPGQAYDASTATSTQAAVSRINYVLQQYVTALVNADAGALREYRSALSPEENALMRAQQLRVRLEEVRVEVNGAEATARCRRKVEGTSASGAPLQEDVVAVYRLVRRPTGWVITDVK